MAPSRSAVHKYNRPEDTRRLTRRERLHQLCTAAANSPIFQDWSMDPPLTIASTWHTSRNQFEPLAHPPNCRSQWSHNRRPRRRRPREHKRKELVDFQLATLDAELTSRFDNVINTSNVQLPELDLSPMQIVKWEPPIFSRMHAPTTRHDLVPDTNWSNLEISFSPPTRKALFEKPPTPPVSLMTAAELGLTPSMVLDLRLPELTSDTKASNIPPKSPLVTTWTPSPVSVVDLDLHTLDSLDIPECHAHSSPFVAAKLPHFHDIDPLNLTTDLTCHVEPSKLIPPKFKPQSTRCTLYHKNDRHDPEESPLDDSQSLRNCEEERMPGLAHIETSCAEPEVNCYDEPVMDWPWDALGEWIDDPVLDWNGETVHDWDDDTLVDWCEDPIMIEDDAETYDWTFVPSLEEAQSDRVSTINSAFSSMEVLSLPLKDSYLEDSSTCGEPGCNLAGDERSMRRVSRSAWETESDFCIPAFFWEDDKSLSEDIFESEVFAVYPLCKENDEGWDW